MLTDASVQFGTPEQWIPVAWEQTSLDPITQTVILPDERFSARNPQELTAAITIRTKDEPVCVKEQHGYEGGLNNHLSWERTVGDDICLTNSKQTTRVEGGLLENVYQLSGSERHERKHIYAHGTYGIKYGSSATG